MLNLGTRRIGLLANNADVHRDLAPAIKVKAKAQDFTLNNGARRFLRTKISARQKDHADAYGIVGRRMPGTRDLFAKEVLRHIDAHTCPVARFAIRVHSPSVPDVLERFECHRDNIAARFSVQGADNANPARIFFVLGIIGVALCKGGSVF